MSRITVPVAKLTRSISSTASVARPTHLLNNGSKAASAAGRKRQSKSNKADEAIKPDTAEYSTSTTTTTATTTPHRPQMVQPRKVPLMQGFRTSAPKPARLDTSGIDFAYLPNLHSESSNSYDPYLNIRVPLLPDTKTPPSNRQPEAFDAPLPQPEIVVIAANPDTVYTASALTEVEGMGVDGVELSFVRGLDHDSSTYSRSSTDELLGGQGMIKDLWKGLVDDVLGPNQQPKMA